MTQLKLSTLDGVANLLLEPRLALNSSKELAPTVVSQRSPWLLNHHQK